MKKVSWFLYLTISLAGFLTGCQHDEQTPTKPGNVRFTLQAPAPDAGDNGRVAASLPDGASLYVTISDAVGNAVYSMKHVTLLKLGDEYISEPLALPPGNYNLQEFLVTDADNNVIYTTPKTGSPLADWVDTPLPLPFAISNDAVTGLGVQVVATDGHDAEDFGYVSFNIDIVPSPYFQLAVFIPGDNGLVSSPAQAYLLDGTDTVYNQSLPAGTNHITFIGDLTKTYTLVVTKRAYTRFIKTFVLSSLIQELDGMPLNAILEPALTVVTDGKYNIQGISAFKFYISGQPNQHLLVDWGDGATSVIGVSSVPLYHEYADTTDHFISVTGDIEGLQFVNFTYDEGSFKDVALDHLENLTVFTAAFTSTPAFVDLTHNPQLMNIEISYSDIRAVNVTPGAPINYFGARGNMGYSAESLDETLHLIYESAVAAGHNGGAIYIDESSDFIAPISQQTLNELHILRSVYAWEILPNNF